jgi:hypothetical protein
MSPHRLPAVPTPAQERLVTTIYSRIAAALAEVRVWRMKRQLLSMDPGLFKDAGVSRRLASPTRKRPLVVEAKTAASAAAKSGSSFDHLISPHEQRCRTPHANVASSGRPTR